MKPLGGLIFPKPKAVKILKTGESEHRNQQFEAIDQLQ
jgi:hypothetical protein